ncbi:MAG: hypothetical protein ACMV0I_06770 [Pseudomonas sp.]
MYAVKVDLGHLLAGNYDLAQKLFPLIQQAVEFTAQEGAFRWKSSVMKARIWEAEKKRYVESIGWKMTSPYEAVISSDYDVASQIENGRPARDLKQVLRTAKRAREVKYGKNKGRKYLIIPFRHNIPTESGEGALAAQMPPDIYARAKTLKASLVLPSGFKKPPVRLSATFHKVPQQSYFWGGRLPAGLAPKLKDTHVTDPYAGMVRFDTSTGKSNRSQYLTFRVMGEWSSGWIVPAKPGLKIAEKVARELQPMLDENVGQAIAFGMMRQQS